MLALEAIVSALGFLALAIFFGHIVAAGFFLPKGEPRMIRLDLVESSLVSLLIFLVISLAALVVQGAKIQRAMPSADLVWRYLTMAQSGHVWLARIVYALALALITWWFSRTEANTHWLRWLALFALPLITSRSLMSHAAALREGVVPALAADAIHLLATALWVGGLIALWHALSLGRKRWPQPISWTADVVDRFSRLALTAVGCIIATGLYQSWIQVGSFATLLSTDYGKTLLLKLSLFLAMLALGALNFFSTKRQLRRSARSGEAAPWLGETSSRRIALESCVGMLIFGVTGLLTVLPPGVHVLHQAAAAKSFSSRAAGDENGRKLTPAEGASVKILSPAADQIFGEDKVPLKFNFAKGKRGQHVHAYVDGELMGMFESKQGTLNGVRPGRHILELRVVAEDHQTELDASDRVEFTVK